jgi:hypothetical protein
MDRAPIDRVGYNRRRILSHAAWQLTPQQRESFRWRSTLARLRSLIAFVPLLFPLVSGCNVLFPSSPDKPPAPPSCS